MKTLTFMINIMANYVFCHNERKSDGVYPFCACFTRWHTVQKFDGNTILYKAVSGPHRIPECG